MLHCQFSINHYKECIEFAQDEGYCIIPTREYHDQKKVILMRHDVDFSLEYANELASIEHDLEIHSSYYIYFHGIYNALSSRATKIIKDIADMGHEIGLHYDSRYSIPCMDLLFKDIKITSVTQHFPAANHKMDINGLLTPNDLPLKYISNSGRNWREGCLCHHIGKEDKLHVNIHPEWLFSDSREDMINKLYQSQYTVLVENMREIKQMLVQYVKDLKL